MSEYIHLIGAEDVRSAGNTMSSAAEQMKQAASSIDDSVRLMGRILEEHAQQMRDLLEAHARALSDPASGQNGGGK